MITSSIYIHRVCKRGAELALSFSPFQSPCSVFVRCVFGQRIGCTDKPSLTFNEARSDELASESHCLLLSWSPNKVLMRTFAPFVPKAQIFLTASQTESNIFTEMLSKKMIPGCKNQTFLRALMERCWFLPTVLSIKW